MKRIFILLVVLCSLFISVDAANNDILFKDLKFIKATDGVVVNSKDKIDIVFNDLEQEVSYEGKLVNNSDDVLYFDALDVLNSSEEFIHYEVIGLPEDGKIEPHSSNKIQLLIKTLDISGAGRNLSDSPKLNFVLENRIINPETFSNILEFIGLLVFLVIIIFALKKKKCNVFILLFLLPIFSVIIVNAKNEYTASFNGKVIYKSQNVLKTTGTIIKDSEIDYENSNDIWKYYDQVLNIKICDDLDEFDSYVKKFDLTNDSNNKVYGYLVENNDEVVPYDLYIIANGVIYANEDATGLFSFPNVKKIDGMEFMMFDETKIMKGMFMGDKKLIDVDLDFDFTNVTDTSYMFEDCYRLEVDEDDFELENVSNKENMFMDSIKLYSSIVQDAVESTEIYFQHSYDDGKFVMSNTLNNNYPIYYYRGFVEDNNVIFANYCWKIVRTTDTGGIKMIYNGKVSANKDCFNMGEDSQIGTSAFDENVKSFSSAGYMYGDIYPYESNILSNTQNGAKYLYGNDITWDGSKYTLVDTVESTNWSSSREELAEKYHYTCFNETGVCEKVNYVYDYMTSSSAYYIVLENGDTFDTIKTKMINNKNDSSIKKTIDDWYKKNMVNYTSYLEDTVFCNDRSLADGPFNNKDTSGLDLYSSFWGAHRVEKKFGYYGPTLSCSNVNDRFTVSDEIGNGKLTYPVGLLTVDELVIAGHYYGNKYDDLYLYTGSPWWTMTPSSYSNTGTHMYGLVDTSSKEMRSYVKQGVRPVISLKNDVNYYGGDGSYTEPYYIK